jgi:hypothetical protein
MPVVESSPSELLLATAPSAMAPAISSLTAPCWAIRASEMSSNSFLEAFE